MSLTNRGGRPPGSSPNKVQDEQTLAQVADMMHAKRAKTVTAAMRDLGHDETARRRLRRRWRGGQDYLEAARCRAETRATPAMVRSVLAYPTPFAGMSLEDLQRVRAEMRTIQESLRQIHPATLQRIVSAVDGMQAVARGAIQGLSKFAAENPHIVQACRRPLYVGPLATETGCFKRPVPPPA